MQPGCIGKSNTNNLPAPTDLTKNPYEKKKLVFKDATQKSARVVLYICGNTLELEPREPIFEKCPERAVRVLVIRGKNLNFDV
jgi:hypothetical protein